MTDLYSAKSGETPLDDISGLKIKIPHITRTQIDALEAQNIQKAVGKYLTGARIKSYDSVFFSKLHKDMFGDVWLWAGNFRTTQTNIGSTPANIRQDLLILQKDLSCWPENEETAIRLHHRAVQIHPFAGGNGRWSRLLSNLWLRSNCGLWVHWPLGMDKESPIRQDYLKALREADALNYEPLITLHKEYIAPL